MIKEVKYGGFSAIPSDYDCKDGELALSLDMLNEDGALRPIMPPRPVLTLEEGEKVWFIHATASFTHYIIYDPATMKVSYIDKEAGDRVEIESLPATLTRFDALGNTLMAFTSKGIYYYLWKNGAYKSLGNHIPDVKVSFGLVGTPRFWSLCQEKQGTFNITFNGIPEGELYNEFSDDNQTAITEQVMAKVNKFVADETVNKGRFCFPFFVRYALRLYDGSLVCHSAPILMNPSTTDGVVVFWKRATGKGSYTSADCDIMLMAARLDYRVIRDDDSYLLEDWEDIVKGVEIFVSKPLYTYDQEGKIKSLRNTGNMKSKFIGRLAVKGFLEASYTNVEGDVKKDGYAVGEFGGYDFENHYCEWDFSRIYAIYMSYQRTYPSDTFDMPEFTEGKRRETLENASTFFKLCSMDFGEALESDSRRTITVDDDYLQSLVNREAMTDDYLTHDRLCAKYSFGYNSRMNLSGLRRRPFDGFIAQTMFAYRDRLYNWATTEKTVSVGLSTVSHAKLDIDMQDMAVHEYAITTYIKENGEDYAAEASISGEFYDLAPYNSQEYTSGQLSETSWGCYVFYPNVNAYKMVISCGSFGSYAIDLKAHEFLNGAFAVLPYEQRREKNYTSLPSVSTGAGATEEEREFPIEIPNKIYTSEVGNPFYFPLNGINTVGTGTIYGICAATKALSEGQFGQFPLYAFATDGVWAMEVSETGTYSAKQPVSRDVCVNPESITQIDTSVLFATDRGIMQISGSNTACISDSLKSDDVFDASALPSFDKLVEIFNQGLEDGRQVSMEGIAMLPFVDFLKDCRMLYDYVNQRIFVYNSSVAYAYVFSMKEGKWGMARSRLTDNVNSYPEALAMQGNALVNLSESDEADNRGLVVTRPFKLGAPDTFKTIETVIQRGFVARGHVRQVLYGSNDLFHWHVVWSGADIYLRGFSGSPYKYFRLALICDMGKAESLYGFTVQLTPRLTNRPR